MMKTRVLILLLVLLLTILFGISALSVSAEASLTEGTLYCDHFVASGESDAPYVTIYVNDENTGDTFFVVVPVSGGKYRGSISYPSEPTGTVFYYEVWGSLNTYTDLYDPGYYDEGKVDEGESPCLPPPPSAACTYPLPEGSVVYSVPLGAPAYFNADLQSSTGFNLPVGTWKISEIKGDFAKVWISCQATPIWIPESAVGGAIG